MSQLRGDLDWITIDAYSLIEKRFPPGHVRVTAAAEHGVGIYDAWGKTDKAAEWRAKLPKEVGGVR